MLHYRSFPQNEPAPHHWWYPAGIFGHNQNVAAALIPQKVFNCFVLDLVRENGVKIKTVKSLSDNYVAQVNLKFSAIRKLCKMIAEQLLY